MIEFKKCPDCGYDGYPTFERKDCCYYGNGEVVNGDISASCYRCGWKTKFHANVKECAKEWNRYKID